MTGLKKTSEDLENSVLAGRESNMGSLESETGVITARPQASVRKNEDIVVAYYKVSSECHRGLVEETLENVFRKADFVFIIIR
jgi:hypothetical protein